MTRQEVVDALVAERYGPSSWWKTPEPPPQDSELAQHGRRKAMAKDFETPAEVTA